MKLTHWSPAMHYESVNLFITGSDIASLLVQHLIWTSNDFFRHKLMRNLYSNEKLPLKKQHLKYTVSKMAPQSTFPQQFTLIICHMFFHILHNNATQIIPSVNIWTDIGSSCCSYFAVMQYFGRQYEANPVGLYLHSIVSSGLLADCVNGRNFIIKYQY